MAQDARILQAGLACGYKFRVSAFSANATDSRVTITNCGVAPIYRDTFVAVNGVRSATSLIDLAPGKSANFEIASGDANPLLTIAGDHLAKGQEIGFEADLK